MDEEYQIRRKKVKFEDLSFNMKLAAIGGYINFIWLLVSVMILMLGVSLMAIAGV